MKDKKSQVQATKKIFDILELLAKHNESMRLKDISAELGLPTSTVHRLLNSLRDVGYVQQDQASGGYALGLKILYLARSVLSNLDLRKIAYSYLNDMSGESGETANLVVEDDYEAMYIEKVESKANVRVFSLIGKRAPMHATGVGKVMLSDKGWSEVLDILKLKGMDKVTEYTIDNVDDLMEELNKIRKQGYALDVEECELDAWCVAAPVRDHTGKVVAAISISLPISRLTDEKKSNFISSVKKYADSLSKRIGYLPEEYHV